ncbi:peptidylprolyl isomerase [bacterium]|nr:peptidylprolyl isomerase [bacterium]
MLNFLKKGAGTFLLGAIAFVFVVSFGPGSNGCQTTAPGEGPTYAIKVGDDEISEGLYQENYRRNKLYYSSLRMNVSENDIVELTVAQLKNEYVLLKEAEKIGLKISEKERNEYIKAQPEFQIEGQFDFQRYKEILTNYYGTTPVLYEESVNRNLMILKMRNILTSSISISENELWKNYEESQKSVVLSYIKFNPTVEKKDVVVTEAEIQEYLKSNEASVKELYEKSKNSYKHAEEVKASHILVSVTKDKDDAKAKSEIEGYLKQIKDGASFEEIAKNHSDCPSKSKGGDLGYFTKDRMVKPFSDAAFALKVGDISEPVKTQFGYHIIKAVDHKQPYEESFDDVKVKITTDLIKDKKYADSLIALKAEAQKIYDNGKDLESILKGNPNLKVEDSSKISQKSSYVNGLGTQKDMIKDAFSTKQGGLLPQIYSITDGFVIASVKELVQADKAEFDKIKQQLKDTTVDSEKNSYLDAWLGQKMSSLKFDVNPRFEVETVAKN